MLVESSSKVIEALRTWVFRRLASDARGWLVEQSERVRNAPTDRALYAALGKGGRVVTPGALGRSNVSVDVWTLVSTVTRLASTRALRLNASSIFCLISTGDGVARGFRRIKLLIPLTPLIQRIARSA